MNNLRKYSVVVVSSIFWAFFSYYLLANRFINKGAYEYSALSVVLICHLLGTVYYSWRYIKNLKIGRREVAYTTLYYTGTFWILAYIKRTAAYGYSITDLKCAPPIAYIIGGVLFYSYFNVYMLVQEKCRVNKK